jgi:hypothetical protein
MISSALKIIISLRSAIRPYLQSDMLIPSETMHFARPLLLVSAGLMDD